MSLIKKVKQFLENRKEKAFERNAKVIKNPKAIKDDRMGAICSLASSKKPAEATKALLDRFDYSLEHGIQDSREKEKALEIILSFGKDALPATLEHLRASKSIAWPVKILSAISSKEELVENLRSSLEFGDIDFSQEIVNKNYDILCHLRDHSLKDKGEALFRFLKAHDERLRVAAVETILTQNHEENFVKLEPFLLDNTSENIRLKQSIAQKFIDEGRKLTQKELFKTGFLHPDLVINKDYSLKYTSEDYDNSGS